MICFQHFHKLHHTYKQPTAFSVTAIHPVEFLNIQCVYIAPMFLMPIYARKNRTNSKLYTSTSPSGLLWLSDVYLLPRHYRSFWDCFQGGHYNSCLVFWLTLPTCRGCGSNLGSRIVFSTTTTISIFTSTLALTLSCGTRYTGQWGRRTGYTERTSSGARGRRSHVPQGRVVCLEELLRDFCFQWGIRSWYWREKGWKPSGLW